MGHEGRDALFLELPHVLQVADRDCDGAVLVEAAPVRPRPGLDLVGHDPRVHPLGRDAREVAAELLLLRLPAAEVPRSPLAAVEELVVLLRLAGLLPHRPPVGRSVREERVPAPGRLLLVRRGEEVHRRQLEGHELGGLRALGGLLTHLREGDPVVVLQRAPPHGDQRDGPHEHVAVRPGLLLLRAPDEDDDEDVARGTDELRGPEPAPADGQQQVRRRDDEVRHHQHARVVEEPGVQHRGGVVAHELHHVVGGEEVGGEHRGGHDDGHHLLERPRVEAVVVDLEPRDEDEGQGEEADEPEDDDEDDLHHLVLGPGLPVDEEVVAHAQAHHGGDLDEEAYDPAEAQLGSEVLGVGRHVLVLRLPLGELQRQRVQLRPADVVIGVRDPPAE
mmetsp:Transcript_62747/g.176972  ORF Transcript_62747/g.176972 Transcript_62747/m.176972 type:complete len:390 (-) Transcript_62747:100-1269(-)